MAFEHKDSGQVSRFRLANSLVVFHEEG